MAGYSATIYLDIDGCLSPLPPKPELSGRGWTPPATWDAWADPRAFNETPMPTGLLDQLGALQGVEVVWATSWDLQMVNEALDEIGYSRLRYRHLAPTTGATGKLGLVQADVAAHDRPFAWIDDARFVDEGLWVPPVPWYRVRPVSTIGLTPDSWTSVVEWSQRARSWQPSGRDGAVRFSELWRAAIARAADRDLDRVRDVAWTAIATYTEAHASPDPEALAALERWRQLLRDKEALLDVLTAPEPDWAWNPFAGVLDEGEHLRLVEDAYGMPPKRPVPDPEPAPSPGG